MSLASAYFRNPYLLWLTVVLLVVAGVSALWNMPRLEDPRIVNRAPLAITAVPGASAERVETLVTEPIEQSLEDISEIKDLSSISRAGVSVVAIELEAQVTAGENERIFSEIRDRLGDVAPDLPPEALAPVLEDERDPAAFTMIVAIGWNGEGEAQLNILNRFAEDLAERLRRIAGTELVEAFGEPQEEITVTVDPWRVAELGLTLADIGTALAAADSRGSAGVLRPAAYDITMEVEGAFNDLDRIADVPLAGAADSAVARLGDVARIERGWRRPPENIALHNGQRVVMLAARTTSGVQVDRWAERARTVVEDYRETIGTNISMQIVFDQSVYTKDRLGNLAFNLALGASIVVVVVLFTMGWRAGVIVGMQLPLVALGSLFVLQMMGGALHQMSIFGMIIALGLLVDNAIVMTDHVTGHLKGGASRADAVARSQSDLFWPLFASTVTTVLAFAPIQLLPGSAGDFVGWIGGAVIIAILLSFLTAQTIVPALAARFYSADRKGGFLATGISWPRGVAALEATLRYGLRRPLIGILVATSPALVGFALAPTLGNQFFPRVDRDMFDVRVWLPQRASLEETRRLVERIDGALRDREEVERTTWIVGASHPPVYYNLIEDQDRSPHYAQGEILVTNSREADRLVRELQRTFDERFPQARILLREYGQGPPVSADIQYRLFGRDLAQIQEVGERLRLALQSHDEVLHTRMTAPRGEPKLWFEPSEEETRLAGLFLGDLSRQVRASVEGATGGVVLEGLADLPVRVRYAEGPRGDLSLVSSTPIIRAGGAPGEAPDWTALSAFGEFDLRPETPALARFDRLRVNTVEGYVLNESLPITIAENVLADLRDSGFSLPAGVTLESGGAAEQNQEAISNLLIYVPALIVAMIGSLILIFRSLGNALILVVTAGLCFGLAALATWSWSLPFSFNTILGTLGLIGVGLNDSIVVLTEIRKADRDRSGDVEAVVRAVSGVLRHVVSTTLTTMGGFLPILLFIGGDFWPALAIVLAGGILGATLLSLGFVPTAYVLMARLRARTQHARTAEAA